MRNKLLVLLAATMAFGLIGCNKEKASEEVTAGTEQQKETVAVQKDAAAPVDAKTAAAPEEKK